MVPISAMGARVPTSLAKRLQARSGDTQEKTAERLQKDQAQISKALNGASKYRGTCMDVIALYSKYEVEYSFFRLKLKTPKE